MAFRWDAVIFMAISSSGNPPVGIIMNGRMTRRNRLREKVLHEREMLHFSMRENWQNLGSNFRT